VDPGEREAILEGGGESGDPARQEEEKAGSWHQTVEEDRHYGMPQNMGDGLATTPSHVFAQSMYHCALCNNYHINNHNRNRVLLYYLFQENKSFGSKNHLHSSSGVREVVSSTVRRKLILGEWHVPITVVLTVFHGKLYHYSG
jgi:hypothetical protein